jgi:hypothetical protein
MTSEPLIRMRTLAIELLLALISMKFHINLRTLGRSQQLSTITERHHQRVQYDRAVHVDAGNAAAWR